MRNLKISILALTGLLSLPAAYASSIQGVMWSVPASTADNVPTLGHVPGTGATELGTFTASEIKFSGDSNYSLGGFLNSFGAASNIVFMNGATANSSLTDVLFEFTGSASFTNGQTFNVLHDDGVNLYVSSNLVLGQPNTTSPITTPFTYTGSSGVFDFDFIYANGPPTQADFQTTLVTSGTITSSNAPEPSSLLLWGVGLLALAVVTIRRRQLQVN
ncbi:MAG TPA: PEP-CTERM sorting domain-containing protein [Bryobacteraceae bacterium]|nr:PEP-CTERM sorting domain-containing protein [Bryobacteraceae bacterium]